MVESYKRALSAVESTDLCIQLASLAARMWSRVPIGLRSATRRNLALCPDAARQPGSPAARQPGSPAARQPGSPAARQPGGGSDA